MSGLDGVLARIAELDRRIRAVDPAWSGGAGTRAGGVAARGATTPEPGSGASSASQDGFADVLAALSTSSVSTSPAVARTALAGAGTATEAAGSSATGAAAYRPAFVTQRKADTPWDDCTLASAAMLADFASGGAVQPTRAQMRAASGVPDRPGASDPTTLDDAARAIGSVAPTVALDRPSTGLRLDWDGFMERIRSGDGAIVQGMYGALSTEERRWDPSFTGGHAVFVEAGPTPDTLWVLDPLAPAGSGGEVMPASDVRRFAEAISGSGPLLVALAPPGPADPEAASALERFDALSSTIPYAAEIRSAAVEAGVDPLLLASVVEAESSFDPNSLSSAGAMGLMQLMPATARALDIRDPYDPVENLRGGAKYLAGDLETYGRVDVALAAYQAGKGAVAAAGGGIPDYPSTRAYIDRILVRWADYLEELPS